VDAAGRVEHSLWSYNQGTPAGADALWFRVTGDERRLDRAARTAHAALAHFEVDDGLWRQPPAFVAILLRNLMAVHAVRPLPGLLATVDGYLDRVWATARDPRTGVLAGGGIGRYENGGVIDHAAVVQLLALRAWPERWWPDIC